jgi:hypothetical protein
MSLGSTHREYLRHVLGRTNSLEFGFVPFRDDRRSQSALYFAADRNEANVRSTPPFPQSSSLSFAEQRNRTRRCSIRKLIRDSDGFVRRPDIRPNRNRAAVDSWRSLLRFPRPPLRDLSNGKDVHLRQLHNSDRSERPFRPTPRSTCVFLKEDGGLLQRNCRLPSAADRASWVLEAYPLTLLSHDQFRPFCFFCQLFLHMK